MQYGQYKQRIERELESLNLLIDEKIINGISYRNEAKRHKELIRQARRARRQPFLTRFLSTVSLF